MDRYDSSTYGERAADTYDDLYPGFDEAAIATLADLARGGRALELGIGTGRIALPLRARGVEVHGIDASPAMVGRLKAKPGAEAIPVTIGDFRDVASETTFSLVYVVANTFFGLLTQEDQVHCFQNVAGRLAGDGLFVLELFVPDMSRFHHGQAAKTARLDTDQVMLDCSLHDPVRQQIAGQLVLIRESGICLAPVKLRYAWPSELDLMARIAGLRLQHRWGGWSREPFTAASHRHISVYGRERGGPSPQEDVWPCS